MACEGNEAAGLHSGFTAAPRSLFTNRQLTADGIVVGIFGGVTRDDWIQAHACPSVEGGRFPNYEREARE